MKLYKFTAIFIPEKDEKTIYNVYVPALPGCLSFGESLTEARYNIKEAIELYLETLLEEGQFIPQDKKVIIPKRGIAEKIIIGVEYNVKVGFPSKRIAEYVG